MIKNHLGHGIGEMHEKASVPNYGKRDRDMLQVGDTIA